ncbi:SET domain-containing protein [Ditylenchus destructor]|nr:SET domain-containing protein [Ditylenchus destructor]
MGSTHKPSVGLLNERQTALLGGHRPRIARLSRVTSNLYRTIVMQNMLDTVVKQKRCKESRRRKSQQENTRQNGVNRISTYAMDDTSRKITEYFPVRRSSRKTTKALENEKHSNLQQLIKTGGNEKYLEIYESEEKGRGICTSKSFEKGEFVIEYKGDILSYKMAKIREEEYAQDCKIGSYMYFFKHHDQHYCVDATDETPYKGRLINHSVLKPNLKTKVVDFGKSFHLVLIAKRDIDEGEELLYDYGDRTACTVAKNPWLLNS